MKVISSLEQLHRQVRPCVVALGTFDGLHIGHQEVIAAARRQASQRGALLAVFTFSNHPLELIKPEQVPAKLLTSEQKYALMESFGVELLLDLPFNKELADLSPQAFVAKLLELNVSGLVIGENFTYGAGGAGNCRSLAEAAVEQDFSLEVRPLVKLRNEVVSSTVVRQLLKQGRVKTAAELLGRCYSLSGVVEHGKERGRLLGFPTANLALPKTRVAVPAVGVYAVRVKIGEKTYMGMANIGNNPTFGDIDVPLLEVHLLDFVGNLYGHSLTVDFVDKVREQVKFASLEQLVKQLEQDKSTCRQILQQA